MATLKAKPTPESATVAGVATALELTVRVPLAEPPMIGAKTIDTVQLAPAAKLPVQPFCVMLNGAESTTEIAPMA